MGWQHCFPDSSILVGFCHGCHNGRVGMKPVLHRLNDGPVYDAYVRRKDVFYGRLCIADEKANVVIVCTEYNCRTLCWKREALSDN